jgi:hypothetical protein
MKSIFDFCEVSVLDDIIQIECLISPTASDCIEVFKYIQNNYLENKVLYIFPKTTNWSQKDATQLSQYANEFLPNNIKRAVLCFDDLTFGSIRVVMGRRFTEGEHVNIFRDKTQALVWLNS